MTTNTISPERIHQQLGKILATENFQHSAALSRFLSFIVKETLAGEDAKLKEYTIAVKVLSREPDFNPQKSPIVRIHAGRLRRALSEYYETEGSEDEILISIPKGSYVPQFSNKQSVVPEARPLAKIEARSRRITVAVLPFRYYDNKQTDSLSYADGFCDHLSTELTKYADLSVISYFSCRKIKDKVADVREAGLVLDARYILTGSIQVSTNRIRITVQLTRSDTSEQVWANTYERSGNETNLFDIQDEIVWQVVSQTAGSHGAISRHIAKLPPNHQPADLDNFNAINWYYYFVSDLSEETFDKAEAALSRAVEEDRNYALGWAILGEVLIGGFFMGHKSKLVTDQLEKAVTYGKTAIRIDPTCQHAYQTIALASLFLQNKTESLKAIEEWSRIKPVAAGVQGAMGFILICCGEYERGFKMLDESINLNPFYQWWLNAGLSFYFIHHRDYSNALYWAEKMNRPETPWEDLLKLVCHKGLGNEKDAALILERIRKDFPFALTNPDLLVGAFLQDKELVAHIKAALL
ncbi:hypothetical protein KJS94_14195 [Flavihumibacter rivuli]|uniref:tetratricopeptide repeat protein n=1 Tax=Flavihumibacter rivuli TaxID=2838156 RepID=UPI001BDEED39|nr:hypothetical protein [Flavihumibacter rivuli]ULQ55796.1 hypothetical protein KJS94_14195 [Flavihumibacter rivuli]